MILLGESTEDYDKHFILTADIDLDPNLPGRKIFDRAVIAPDTDPNDDYSFYQGNPFTGVFDGNSHVIHNLRIQGEGYLGLFGNLDTGAKISDLGLEAVEINGTGEYIGSLVSYNCGSITTSYSTGTVSGKWFVGGLVARNGSFLTRSFLTTSYSTATVTGQDYVGGLVGYNSCIITLSHSIGEVMGDSVVGGLVGNNLGRTNNSYSICSVSGQYAVGGFIGSNGYYPMTGGGLVGPAPGNIVNCYSVSSVYGMDSVGGLVGENSLGESVNSFWDIETSGQTISDGGIGKTTAEMQTASTFDSWIRCEPLWTIDEGNDYPRLYWENQPGEILQAESLSNFLVGIGTKDDPFLIHTPKELNLVSMGLCDWDKHFKLMADIDMSGFSYERALIAPDMDEVEVGFQGTSFTGVFDGNSHTISHLKINGVSYLGLFGLLDSEGIISNLAIEMLDVNGDWPVGGLVGENRGSISMISCSGTVIGSGGVGGIIGENYGSIDASYSTGEVKGVYRIGGLLGDNRGSITTSFSSSTVNGSERIGGLVGVNPYGTISTSYSVGRVIGNKQVGGLVGSNSGGPVGSSYHGSVVKSFWDIETSGQTASDGGIGKSTAEMQSASTFINSGWDFVDETDNGTEYGWWIDEGNDYPRLWWELIPEN